MLIDFRQFLYYSVEKVQFKADFLFFAWQKCEGKHEHTIWIYSVYNMLTYIMPSCSA